MFTVTQHPAAVLVAVFALVAAGSRPAAPGANEEDEELEGRVPTAIELVPSVEASFQHESYLPGETATLVVRHETAGARLQLFRVGAERGTTRGNNEMRGVPVTHARRISEHVSFAVGDWRSGLYFARLEATDGRVGFAPFVVRPSDFGASRVAVVLPTLTWQAYNLRDDDGGTATGSGTRCASGDRS